MDTTIDDVRGFWKRSEVASTSPSPVKETEMTHLIRSRERKDRRIVGGYMVTSWIWQFIVYAFAINIIVRFWDNGKLVLAGMASIALYVPFTVMYARFCAESMKQISKRKSNIKTIGEELQLQYNQLNKFFKFKKRFDLVGIPVIGLIILMVFLGFDIIPTLSENPIPAVILYILIELPFIIATYAENKKRFIAPLERLKALISELSMPEPELL